MSHVAFYSLSVGVAEMCKADLKKDLSFLYNPSAKQVTVVNVPKMNFLMVDGEGNPNTSRQYAEAAEALFSVSYALKFMVKKRSGVDYGVMPLEGLWWVDDLTKFSIEHKDDWKWTSIIMQPKFVNIEDVKAAIEQAAKKKNLPALPKLRFESSQEGLCAQIMHIGPYSAEGQNIQKIHDYIKKSGNNLTGKHHEIYLNDPRKTAQERLKTILRQPMKK